jgi:hypothetical protein
MPASADTAALRNNDGKKTTPRLFRSTVYLRHCITAGASKDRAETLILYPKPTRTQRRVARTYGALLSP